MTLETDIASYRNEINKHNQRSKKVEKMVEKEKPFFATVEARLGQSWHGVKNRVKITRALTKNRRYKERKLKSFSDELVHLDSLRKIAGDKKAELEAQSEEGVKQIMEVAAKDDAFSKERMAEALGVKPEDIHEVELTPIEKPGA